MQLTWISSNLAYCHCDCYSEVLRALCPLLYAARHQRGRGLEPGHHNALHQRRIDLRQRLTILEPCKPKGKQAQGQVRVR